MDYIYNWVWTKLNPNKTSHWVVFDIVIEEFHVN